MTDWRQNPNLVECFENCVAMFREMPAGRPLSNATDARVFEAKRRREAAGISQLALSRAMGVNHSYVSEFEVGRCHGSAAAYRRIMAALDRLEAERAQ